MKKMLAGLVATFMMLGLVAGLSAGAANATSRYPDSVPTGLKLRVPDRVHKGERARIGVKVVGSGNTDPKNGTVTIRVVRNAGGYRYVEVKDYNGGWVYFTTTKLTKVGKYAVHARYDRPGANSPWQDSNKSDHFKVVR